MKFQDDKVTAVTVRAALAKRFAAPECAIVYEVAQATGFSANRHLDAIAMDLWPSRGLSLHGIEIKVSRNDWRREKKDPTKAEEIGRFCDYFYVAAPKGVVPLDEVPMAWGLLELDGGKLIQARAPAKTEAQPINRNFLAAMLRAASRSMTQDEMDLALARKRKEMDENYAKRVEETVKFQRGQDGEKAKSWDELLELLGENPKHWYGDKDIIEAILAVRKSKIATKWAGLGSVILSARADLKKLEGFAADLGLEVSDGDGLQAFAKRRTGA